MPPSPISQLRFKATHNSYDRGRPPEEQIDDFGVWAIELDVSVPIENRPPRLVVGHDGPGKALGNDLSGGDPDASSIADRFRLEYYLTRIKTCSSIKFRPIVIFFEKKAWFFDNLVYSDPRQFLALLENELISVFER